MFAKIKCLIIACFLLGIATANAATLEGKVLNESNEALIGATVVLKGTNLFAIAGLDGTYLIKNIPANQNLTLVVSFVGYNSFELNVLFKTENEVLNKDFVFGFEQALMSDDMVVYGDAEAGNDAEAQKSEKESSTVVNVISSKAIQLSADITVANVVQRVSGVSIVRNSNGDPQHAIVRGMDKRYNYTLVNGLKIPSPDNKNRYVPLDIFPASLLEKLEVTKALTPSMEGDAIGGVINMIMKNAPAKLTVSGDFQTGYNQINLDRKFMTFDKGATDYLTPYEKYGPLYKAQFSDFSKDNLVIKEVQPLPDVLGNISIGNRYFKKKLGVLAAIGYQNT